MKIVKLVAITFVSTIVLLVLLSSCMSQGTDTPKTELEASQAKQDAPQKEEPKETDHPGIAEYEQVKVDMSQKVVLKILGTPRSTTDSQVGDYKTTTHIYAGNGGIGSSIIVVFSDDKVMSKSQSGLK